MISAYLAEMGITIGQTMAGGKSNEIPAMRQGIKAGTCLHLSDSLVGFRQEKHHFFTLFYLFFLHFSLVRVSDTVRPLCVDIGLLL